MFWKKIKEINLKELNIINKLNSISITIMVIGGCITAATLVSSFFYGLKANLLIFGMVLFFLAFIIYQFTRDEVKKKDMRFERPHTKKAIEKYRKEKGTEQTRLIDKVIGDHEQFRKKAEEEKRE